MKNIILWLFCIALFYQLTAEQPIHNSIYNTPSSSNAIYNGYNLFTENDNYPEQLDGRDDDLDVENDILAISENPRHNSLLQKMIIDNNLTGVQNLLHEGTIDVNYQNKDGRTALHFAALEDNNQIVLLLLEYSAQISLQDYQGWTPLHVAVDANAFAVVKTLIMHHADTSIENNESKTPQDYAKNDMMKSLLQHNES